MPQKRFNMYGNCIYLFARIKYINAIVRIFFKKKVAKFFDPLIIHFY